jgi:hypothetical protein
MSLANMDTFAREHAIAETLQHSGPSSAEQRCATVQGTPSVQ